MRWLTTSFCLMMVAVFGLPTVTAQEAQFASLQERLDEVEAQLARYRNGASFEASYGDEVDYDSACSTPGLLFGAEIAFLKPHHSEGQTQGYDYEATPRIWIGWQTESGLGLRARWFEFDGVSTNPASFYQDLNMMLLDLEVTDTFTLGSKWSGVLSGGFRYAEYREERSAQTFNEMDGAMGLVAGVELYRPITCNVSLFGMGRTSFLYADSISLNGVKGNDDYTFAVSELQLGAEYRRVLSGTTYLFARAAAEAQFWTGVSGDRSQDVGLLGGAFALGLAR